MEKGYYISRPGEARKGPYTIEQLNSMWTSGAITADVVAEDETGNSAPVASLIKKIQDKEAIDKALKGCSGVNGCSAGCGLIIVLFFVLWLIGALFTK